MVACAPHNINNNSQTNTQNPRKNKTSKKQGITTAIVFQHGFGSAAFALALGISSIVMYDAAGVRRHAGRQAEVLNQVVGELLDVDHPVQSVKLKEVLGHTPLQVAAGALLGILFGIFYPV